MQPMALNVPVAMFMSMVVAFTVTPWLSYQVLKGVYGKGGHAPVETTQTLTYRVYKAVLTPFLNSRLAAWGLILFVGVLLLVSMALPALCYVPLKMLPFDNKNEFQFSSTSPKARRLSRPTRRSMISPRACEAPRR